MFLVKIIIHINSKVIEKLLFNDLCNIGTHIADFKGL